MTLYEIVSKRRIEEILHFTTNNGITGILATGALKARNLLPAEKYLEHIYRYNCRDRCRDKSWWGYVNLSITSVNRQLFRISTGKWHVEDAGWWCILSFAPEICTHNGVYFTTTNNMYSGVKRLQGASGIEAMFAPKILKWSGQYVVRPDSLPENQPTCEQAEVLYPNEVSLKYLTKVYLANDEDASRFDSIKSIFSDWSHIPCIVNERLFL